MALLSPRSGRSAIGRYGRARADIKKIRDCFDPGVEDKSARAGANVIALASRGLQGVRWEQARHAKQRLAEAVLDDSFVIRKNQRLALSRVDVQVEQEAAAVAGREALEPIGRRLRIAVGRVAVGHVQDGWRKGGRMLRAPLIENLDRGVETRARRCLAVTARLEPDGKSHRLLHDIAIEPCDLLGASLDPERSFGEAGDDM